MKCPYCNSEIPDNAKFCNEGFLQGEHEIKLTNIAGGTNTTGLGVNVAALVVYPY